MVKSLKKEILLKILKVTKNSNSNYYFFNNENYHDDLHVLYEHAVWLKENGYIEKCYEGKVCDSNGVGKIGYVEVEGTTLYGEDLLKGCFLPEFVFLLKKYKEVIGYILVFLQILFDLYFGLKSLK